MYGGAAKIEWDEPKCYKSPIKCYKIYMGTWNVTNQDEPWRNKATLSQDLKDFIKIDEISSDNRTYEFKDLQQNLCYYFHITAENEHGESYKHSVPLFMQSGRSDGGGESLYVWGSNKNAELALQDDQVLDHKD